MTEKPGEMTRLRQLEALGLLDTPEDDRFDRITAVAAEWLEMPVSLLSLVDRDRQWFKSHHGLDLRETPRAIAFCATAIEFPDGLVVPDARLDPRFRDNPLVTEDPHFRSYAGRPLRDSTGVVLGTLNVLDHEVRHLSDREIRLLDALACWAETEIAREEAEALRQLALNANRVKNEFLTGLSHELRTPLNSVLGYTELLRSGAFDDDGGAAEALDVILRSGRHVLGLLDELLDCARLESGDTVLDLEPVDVDVVIAETASALQPQAIAAGVHLDAVPGRSGDVVALADRRRLLQVLFNLVSNAIKYNHAGGSVRLVAEHSAGDLVAVAVEDTGIGIPAEHRHRLFQPFDRLDADRLGIEGTGVGLSVCASLVKRMDGTITVRSTPDAGSTFTVVLPAARTPAARPPSPTELILP